MHKKCSARKLEKCQPRQPPFLSLLSSFLSGENLETGCAKAEHKNVSAAFCRLYGARPNFPGGDGTSGGSSGPTASDAATGPLPKLCHLPGKNLRVEQTFGLPG